MTKKSFKNPVFVLGYPRSGTTLLRALLGAHSKIHFLHEPEIVRGMRTAGISVSEPIKREGYDQMLRQIGSINICRRHLSTLSTEKLARLIDCPEDLSFREVYEFLLPKPEKAEIWGEKSIGNVFYVSELHKLYPNAMFVNIVRDPRAALLSHYRKKYAASADRVPLLERRSIRFFARGAILWKHWLDAFDTARKLLGESSMMQIRYNDLVKQPETELKKVCSGIGVEFEREMTDASCRKNDPVLSSGVYGAYAHKKINKTIDPRRAHAEKELPGWASYIVEKYVAREMEKLNFAPQNEPIGFGEKIRVETELLLSEKKIRSKIRKDINTRKGLTKKFSPKGYENGSDGFHIAVSDVNARLNENKI